MLTLSSKFARQSNNWIIKPKNKVRRKMIGMPLTIDPWVREYHLFVDIEVII